MNYTKHITPPTKQAVLGLCLLCLSGPSYAQDVELPIDLGFGVTTFGPSIQGRYRIDDKMAVRAFYAGGLNYEGTENIDGTDYDVSGKLGGIGLMFDYRPLQSGWYISGGAFISSTKANGTVTASQDNPITVNGTVYSMGETASVEATFKNKIAPTITTGYAHTFDSGWMVSGEVGAIVVGGFDVTGTSSDLSQADIDAEIAEISQDLEKVKALPFVGLKLGFSF